MGEYTDSSSIEHELTSAPYAGPTFRKAGLCLTGR